MKTIFKITHPILPFLTAVLIIISSIFFGVSGGLYAAAETESLMDELSRITIDGKAFNEADFPAVADGQAEVLYFHESGYSYYGNSQSDYELIVYIYNPNQSSVIADIRNTIQMKTGSAARYEKYTLSLERSTSDNRFFKFSVKLSEAEKTEVLSSLDSSARRYEISSIELMYSGFNATDIAIEQTYIFSGYEEGLGQIGDDTELSATLNYTIEGGAETVPLEVKHTTWRPGESNGNSDYTQDSLHSVYFAVPNEIDSRYDYLNSVHCRWLEAYLAPMIATDNTDLIQSIKDLLFYNTGALGGEIIGGGKPTAPTEFDFSKFNYAVLSNETRFDWLGSRYYNIYAFGDNADFYADNVIERIFLAMQTDDNGIVTSDGLLSAIQNEANYGYFVNDKAVASKYPSYLFESYDTQFTDTVISVGEDYTLTSEEVTRGWWEKLFGGSHIEDSQEYSGIQAIQEVEALTGNKAADCANYYISESDYSEFYEFYKQNKDTSRIYLLRFAVSEYTAIDCYAKNMNTGETISTNTYIAQESVYLDFDIIDLEYIKEDVSYVLPVSMSPIDITPGLTPPPDMDDESFLWYGVGIIAGLIAFYVVYRFVIDKTDKAKEREVIDNLYKGGRR